MTNAEHALLLAVAKAIIGSLDTPFKVRREIQDLVRQIAEDEVSRG